MTQENFKVHAFITLSNCGGIEIMLNRSNDGVFYRMNNGQNLSKEPIREAGIWYNKKGEPYFRAYRTVYYLNEAIRANI